MRPELRCQKLEIRMMLEATLKIYRKQNGSVCWSEIYEYLRATPRGRYAAQSPGGASRLAVLTAGAGQSEMVLFPANFWPWNLFVVCPKRKHVELQDVASTAILTDIK